MPILYLYILKFKNKIFHNLLHSLNFFQNFQNQSQYLHKINKFILTLTSSTGQINKEIIILFINIVQKMDKII